jgi:catechol 2,3-dioxygenase-like lactoylglutathione lyase family enzyme
MGMHLHVEFFVEDLARSREFYTSVLGFSVVRHKPDGFTELSRGFATIALNARGILHRDQSARPAADGQIGKGIELVLVTEDLPEIYEHVLASGWPISTPLTRQPWGMTDFRVVDPDGVYIRVTAPRDG